MELNHTFTVPATVDETWAAFEDIESVAGCFPGATVTEVSGEDFKGSCKVKLGPIALVYTGTGHFVEKDQSAGRFVIEAKGKDKRGNGTAGATVTATLEDAGSGSTEVNVATDLNITGKPAQFGRGVMQDVSDKLLGQFVTCLESKFEDAGSGAGSASSEPESEQLAPAPPTPESDSAPPAAAPAADPDAPAAPAGQDDAAAGASTTSSAAAGSVGSSAGGGARKAPSSTYAGASTGTTGATGSSRPSSGSTGSGSSGNDEALDLGATVLPILARTYGKQAGLGLLLVVIGYLLGRRAR